MLQNAITRVSLWSSNGCGPGMSRRLDGRDLVVRCSLAPTKIGAALNEMMTGAGGQIQRTAAQACQLIVWMASAADEADCFARLMERMNERTQARSRRKEGQGREGEETTAGLQKQASEWNWRAGEGPGAAK